MSAFADQSAEQELIKKNAETFLEAFNRGDADAIANLFSEDGELVESKDSRFVGREEIRLAYEEAFANVPSGKLSLRVTGLRFVTPDVAIEEGTTTWYPDGETATVESDYRAAHVKRDGKWMIASVRTMDEEILTPYEYLRDLQWMVGDWVDESRGSLVINQVKWSPKRAFLLREFTIKRAGSDLLTGTQRIGWDASKKAFRSWTFDSEGGFVEGTWTRIGNGYVIRSAGVLRDGTIVSGTTRVDPKTVDRIGWSMFDRLRGAEILPDVDVTLVRKPPAPAAE